ncbi:MAG TPA: TRAP transporter large permease subunit, partial [Candidatus Acidoferrum sp.]|nr:TRAP transporter large permease subunit [Candidatus Acidoferrum sp.]
MNGLWATTATFLVLFVLRVPVFLNLLAASAVGLLLAPIPIPLQTLPETLWGGPNHYILLAVPFFILMGDLALVSGVTRRL